MTTIINTHDMNSVMGIGDSIPVSYTHLDVYKRQAMLFSARLSTG